MFNTSKLSSPITFSSMFITEPSRNFSTKHPPPFPLSQSFKLTSFPLLSPEQLPYSQEGDSGPLTRNDYSNTVIKTECYSN